MSAIPRRLDQLLPNFSYGDAIGNHAIALQGIFRRRGFTSDIFAQMRHPRLRGRSRDYTSLAALAGGGACLYHFSIGSPLSAFFRRLPAVRVLVYHNVTPARYLAGVNRRVELECRRGRRELAEMAGETALALADSEFNRRELVEMGYRRTAVVPIIVDRAACDVPPRRELAKRLDDGCVNVLHVGRFVPNKRLDDVVKAFAVYQKINPRSRLILAGTDVNLENYSGAIRDLVRRLDLQNVLFPGHVDFADLCTYYRSAHLYLIMSEHEGFCVPLLEAMHFGVPVVARRAAAVPGTLGGAGLLVDGSRPEETAEVMHRIAGDRDLRERLAAAGRERLRAFDAELIETRLWAVLADAGVISA